MGFHLKGRVRNDSQEVVIPFDVWASGKTRPPKNKQISSGDSVLEVFLQKYCLPLRCESQWKPLPESPGRHFALPVAYLSKVTHHLSRFLKKTPASAFTPILHDHISFPRPLRLLFHFLLRCRYHKVKMACCLFIYKSCSWGMHIFKKSQRNFHWVHANKAMTDTPQMPADFCPTEMWELLGKARKYRLQPQIIKHIVTCFLLYLHFKCQHERTAEAPSLTHVRTGIVHSVELTITQEQGSNHVRNVHQTSIKMLYCPHTWQIAFWQVAGYSHCYYDNMVISVKLIMPFNAGRLSVSIILPDLSP